MSVFLYASFYYNYMPQIHHKRDVSLQYGIGCEKEDLCQYPWANISLTKNDGTALLSQGQQYVIEVTLELPESDVNRKAGIFMVQVLLYSHNAEVVQQAARSAMLEYRSFLLQTMDTLLFAPLYLLGSDKQQQSVRVELFTRYQDDTYKPALGAYVQMQNKDVEIYSTTLTARVHFTGLRYLMYFWPVLTSVTGTMIFFWFLSLIVMSYYIFVGFGLNDDESYHRRISDAGQITKYLLEESEEVAVVPESEETEAIESLAGSSEEAEVPDPLKSEGLRQRVTTAE